jgi:RNA-directed DNA polymerase
VKAEAVPTFDGATRSASKTDMGKNMNRRLKPRNIRTPTNAKVGGEASATRLSGGDQGEVSASQPVAARALAAGRSPHGVESGPKSVKGRASEPGNRHSAPLGATGAISDRAAPGQSSRSSPSAGKPRTRRRGTVQPASKQGGRTSGSTAPNGATYITNMQRKLFARSRERPERTFEDLFNWVHHPTTLAEAWRRVSRRKASRTAGVDGTTRSLVEKRAGGVEAFLEDLRCALKDGTYRPLPVRERLIPKPGKPGKFRPLGIPTLRDRVVQMAMKLVLEPIFEADFFPTSYGFRPGRCTMDAIRQVAELLMPKVQGPSPYTHVIEGDIKACFENVDHHLLMDRVRRRIRDKRMLRLTLAFLRAGVMSEGTLRHPTTGTPQGGVVSPLLANIYLQAIEERYRRHVPNPHEDPRKATYRRSTDRKGKRPRFFVVRYADDFVVLVTGDRQNAETEKAHLAEYIRSELRMELSAEKTLVTDVRNGFNFLGYRIRVSPALRDGKMVPKPTIPTEAAARFRSKVRELTRGDTSRSLRVLLMQLNPIVVGWRNYYRYAVGAWRVFQALDHFMWFRVQHWLRRKHPRYTAHEIRRRYIARPRSTTWSWHEDGLFLRKPSDGGTSRYPYRGFKIQNGWDDTATGARAVWLEVGDVRAAASILTEVFDESGR